MLVVTLLVVAGVLPAIATKDVTTTLVLENNNIDSVTITKSPGKDTFIAGSEGTFRDSLGFFGLINFTIFSCTFVGG